MMWQFVDWSSLFPIGLPHWNKNITSVRFFFLSLDTLFLRSRFQSYLQDLRRNQIGMTVANALKQIYRKICSIREGKSFQITLSSSAELFLRSSKYESVCICSMIREKKNMWSKSRYIQHCRFTQLMLVCARHDRRRGSGIALST